MSLACGQAAFSAHDKLLVAQSNEYDFGQIRYDSGVHAAEFTLTNISSGTVEILDIHTQCRCANPSWDSKAIPAGGSTKITVTYDPSHFIGPQKVGLTVIATGGEYKKYTTLVVKADVLRDQTIQELRHPEVLYGSLRSDLTELGMRLRKRGDRPVRSFELFNDSPDQTYTVAFYRTSPALSLKSYEILTDTISIRPGQTMSIDVKMNTMALETGPFHEKLFLVIDDTCVYPISIKGAIE